MSWVSRAFRLSLPNVLVGLGIALVAPVILPAVGYIVRPLAKGVIKAGHSVKDMVVSVTAEAGEQISDLVAEAKGEHYGKPEA
jgi:hypothetical protein